jgi:hypothetical protein
MMRIRVAEVRRRRRERPQGPPSGQ